MVIVCVNGLPVLEEVSVRGARVSYFVLPCREERVEGGGEEDVSGKNIGRMFV